MNGASNDASHRNVQNVRTRGAEGFFSPKQVATAIGMSESSLKRWCDAGTILSSKTAGGHRRMSKADVVEFLKRKSHGLRDPTAIGLPNINTVSIHGTDDAIAQLLEAILKDDLERCREIIIYLYIDGCELPTLFDQVISAVFKKIGEMWNNGEAEVYQERRGCELCLNVFRELKLLLPKIPQNALLAIGASPSNDHYMLPSAAVELTLIANGWDARSLGSNIPFSSLLTAVKDYQPSLVWISLSHVENADQLVEQFNEFSSLLGEHNVLVTGGNALSQDIRTRIQNSLCCDNLSQLVSTIRNLRIPRPDTDTDTPLPNTDSPPMPR